MKDGENSNLTYFSINELPNYFERRTKMLLDHFEDKWWN